MIRSRIRVLLARRRAQKRKRDVLILWPSFVKVAANEDQARAAFAFHAMNEPSWTQDMGDHEIVEYAKGLRA